MSEEDWLVFYREAHPVGVFISVDRAVTSGRVAIPGTCYEMQFRFSPSQVDERGMPNRQVQSVYYAAEDRLTDSIKTSGGRIVASRTGQNKRSVWLCGPAAMAPTLEATVADIKDFAASFTPASSSEVRALHPTPLESQLAQNFQIFDHLTQQGDDHSVPRKIDHFIYGVTATNRAAIETRLKRSGFQINEIRKDAVLFSRMAPIALDALDNDVRLLSALCDELGCEYDGWGTPIVRRAN